MCKCVCIQFSCEVCGDFRFSVCVYVCVDCGLNLYYINFEGIDKKKDSEAGEITLK